MKKIYLIVMLLGVFGLGKAQTFTVHPSNTVSTTLDSRGSVDVYIHFANSFQVPLSLIWEVTSSTYPAQWFMSVCDNFACYTLPHPIDTMASVAVGDSGFLKLTCVPTNVNGTGSIVFHVFDQNSPTSSANVTFNFTATTITSVDVDQLEENVAIAPNPANDHVSLKARNGQLDKGVVKLYDLKGQLLLEQTVNAVQMSDLDVQAIAPGIYMLRYESKAGTLNKKVVVAH